MSYETVVAVYDTEDHAARAVQDLEAAGVPASAIDKFARNAGATETTTATTAPREEPGFWSRLFGTETEYGPDGTVFDRSVEGGSTVVTVKASEQYLQHIMDILERHNPVDIDERAASYEAGTHQGTAAAAEATTMEARGLETRTASTGAPASDAMNDTDLGHTGTARGSAESIPLSEENLAVGKRVINRGTTRIRRYVVETPVEEQVALRDETVSIERRPVAEGRTVSKPDFTDKVVEVTETAEEAVASKTARVREEVVINKQANERTETVRDTVRREDVEITKEPGPDGSGRDTARTETAQTAPNV